MIYDFFKKIERCRICGNKHYDTVLDLGEQYAPHFFNRASSSGPDSPKGPLRLVKCSGCNHIQLEYTLDRSLIHHDGGGYPHKVGLDPIAVKQLKSKSDRVKNLVKLKSDDILLDIQGNDGTFLEFFDKSLSNKWVMDSAIEEYYRNDFPSDVNYMSGFFTSSLFKKTFGRKKAKVVSTFSVLNDLEKPIEFARQIRQILSKDGVWILEQNYLGSILETNNIGLISHNHLSYYDLSHLKFIMDNAGLKIIDVELNDVNGGSISIIVSKDESSHEECTDKILEIFYQEKRKGLSTVVPWQNFSNNISLISQQLKDKMEQIVREELNIATINDFCGITAPPGASTIIQTFGLPIKFISEIHPEKLDYQLPGLDAMIQEEQSSLKKFNFFILFSTHLKDYILANPKYKNKKICVLFPKPHWINLY